MTCIEVTAFNYQFNTLYILNLSNVIYQLKKLNRGKDSDETQLTEQDQQHRKRRYIGSYLLKV